MRRPQLVVSALGALLVAGLVPAALGGPPSTPLPPGHGVLLTPPIKVELKLLGGIRGAPASGRTFTGVVAYWSGSTRGLTGRIPVVPYCTASIWQPATGRRLGSLGEGEVTDDPAMVVHEGPDGPPLQAMTVSWKIPAELAGVPTADQALMVRCTRSLLVLESVQRDRIPDIQFFKRLRPDFVRWFHIYRAVS